MDLFQSLGAGIENLWLGQNYNEDIFPSLAADALKKADLPSKISAWEIVEWTLNQSELPRQKDPQARFGEPPITLFVAPRFYIDVYIWLEGTTAIHQHGFCGAFQVLMGSSIHSWYEFELREKINSFLEIGDMRLKVCELLKVGDVQAIDAGRQYVHSLFHLDQPSVTIVVRTDRSPLSLPQFAYHKPSLAVDPFYDHETTTRKLQTISALFRAKHPETDRLIGDVLNQSDFHTSFLVLQTVHDWVRSDHLTRLFDHEGPDKRFNGFLDIVRQQHGEKADVFRELFARKAMADEIVNRRGVITNPEHRFFLALLLNVEGRQNIFSLIKQRFPDADPIDKILDWTFDLAQTRVVGMKIPNALGIADFDSFDLSVLEYLLKDVNEKEMADRLATDYPVDDASNTKLGETLSKIKNSVIFVPLLSEMSQKSFG
jgi:hypothetical protein